MGLGKEWGKALVTGDLLSSCGPLMGKRGSHLLHGCPIIWATMVSGLRETEPAKFMVGSGLSLQGKGCGVESGYSHLRSVVTKSSPRGGRRRDCVLLRRNINENEGARVHCARPMAESEADRSTDVLDPASSSERQCPDIP